ncbi:MAG: 30S ribosomal protein S27ae [Nanoarchaeota archaeon]|nr:30S ribosomal protein S27ae [Nanoarchaeota archaeon]
MATPRSRPKKHVNKKPVAIHKLYNGGKTKNQFCPKCGPGFFMANHKNRWTCGKCNYVEFKKD